MLPHSCRKHGCLQADANQKPTNASYRGRDSSKQRIHACKFYSRTIGFNRSKIRPRKAFRTGREAKEFLTPKIVHEAQREPPRSRKSSAKCCISTEGGMDPA